MKPDRVDGAYDHLHAAPKAEKNLYQQLTESITETLRKMSIEEANKAVCIKFMTTSPPDSFDLLAEDLSWTIMGKESGSDLKGSQSKA